MTVYCGIDVGTQGSKVGLYRDDGTCVADAYAEHLFDNIRPGWVEMDPDQILDAVVTAFAEAVHRAGIGSGDVAAIAMSGILCGPVFVDEDWRPVRPIIPFLDVRATDEVAWLANEIEPRWVTESANAALDTYVMPAVYEWVRRHEPDVCARIAKILSLAPYIGGCLAGLRAKDAYTDPSHLSGWIIGWNAATGRISEAQLDDLGIDAALAPTVHAPWEVAGHLSAPMAERIGISPGVPICAGAGDVMQSNLGAGLTRPGLATDVAGTASILTVGVTEPSPAITAVPGMLYSLGTIPGQALYWGYVKAGGLSLRWFRDEILGRHGDDALYVDNDALAAAVAPGSDGVLFTPYLSGGNPDNPHAAGTWLGMTMATGMGTLWRSMLESIAYEYADFLDVFAANGAPVREVLAVGGGARSAVWNQIKADAVGLPWRVPSRQDGAILANAALAMRAVGTVDDLAATIGGWVGEGAVSVPDPAAVDAYGRVRTTRAALLDGPLPELFATLAPLRSQA
ncbi:MAG: xylulokinase [Acidimicrobiales bacterium]